MNRFYPAYLDPDEISIEGLRRKHPDAKEEDLQEQARRLANDEVWMNDLYQVNVDRSEHPMIHLSIKRIDKKPLRDWRHFQQIKNELVGRECEAVELYPAESRVVDTANQYHLWAIDDPAFRFPCGFSTGLKRSESSGGAVQRPLKEETS
jgi:hypothetical protein